MSLLKMTNGILNLSGESAIIILQTKDPANANITDIKNIGQKGERQC